MQTYFDQTLAIFSKDIRQWARDRQAAVGPMLLPIVLMLIATVLFGFGGDEWNVGLVVNDASPEAQEFASMIENLQSNISPYFRIITRDPQQAEQLVKAGRLQMTITIPDDFGARVRAGQVPEVQTRLFNINTDMTKNARLRLERAIQDYLASRGQAVVTIS